jgi:hypothetical protein
MAVKYKNPGRVTFEAKIEVMENGGAFVRFPFDVEKL